VKAPVFAFGYAEAGKGTKSEGKGKELIVKRLNPSGNELSAVSYELINYEVIYSKVEEKIKNPPRRRSRQAGKDVVLNLNKKGLQLML